jgi:hypothetical protein
VLPFSVEIFYQRKQQFLAAKWKLMISVRHLIIAHLDQREHLNKELRFPE